jgi:hypothetical protein
LEGITGFLFGFPASHVTLGLLLLDGILLAFVWFSTGHISRAADYVIWTLFLGFLFGFPAGHE